MVSTSSVDGRKDLKAEKLKVTNIYVYKEVCSRCMFRTGKH